MRQSTSEHTRKTNLRLQERQDAPRRRRGAHRDRPLTQEELLAEAKITAELNIRSLGKKEHVNQMSFQISSHQKASWLYDIWRVYFVGYSINRISLTLSKQIIPNHQLYSSKCDSVEPIFLSQTPPTHCKWYIVIMVVCNMSWFTQWLRRELRTLGGGQEEASPQEATFWRTNHSLPFSADATCLSLSPKGRKCGCWRVRIPW